MLACSFCYRVTKDFPIILRNTSVLEVEIQDIQFCLSLPPRLSLCLSLFPSLSLSLFVLQKSLTVTFGAYSPGAGHCLGHVERQHGDSRDELKL